MRHARQAGFSLIEVVITIGILMSLTIAVASMLRAGFEVREGLSERAKVMHRLSVVMEKVSDDLQHAFFVSAKDTAKNGIGRTTKSVFKIEKGIGAGGDKLSLTTKTHRAMRAGAFETDLTYVVYHVLESKDVPGRLDLYRGETPFIPGDLRDDPPMRLLARNISGLILQPWTGDSWSNEYWDTGRGDTRNLLPKLVRVTVSAWLHDRVEGEGADEQLERETETMQTAIYLSDSWEYKELKSQLSTIKWSNL